MKADADVRHQLKSVTRARPFSPALVVSFLRVFDLFVMGTLGIGIYVVYVYPADGYVNLQYYLVSIGLASLLTGLVASWVDAYGGDLLTARYLRADRIVVALAITFALLSVIAFALKVTTFYSRVWALSWFVSTMTLLAFGRAVFGRLIAHLAAQGRFANRTVIVGTGAQAARLAKHLERYDSVCTRILGLVDDNGSAAPVSSQRWPLLGGIDTLIELIRGGRVDQVFVALPWQEEQRLGDVVQRLAVTPIAIRVAPDLAAFSYVGRSCVQVAGLPMLHVFDRPISGWSRFTKAAEDYVLAIFILVTFSPLLLFIALAIKLDSRGPVLFRQHRLGFNNAPIEVWKFRSMYVCGTDADAVRLVTKDDPRVTRIGWFLRRLSLDELPQLVNVLRGEMSIVGPRPHALKAKAENRLYSDVVDGYAARHRVKPGITGWAQVNGWRGETDTLEKIQKRVEYDLYYIDNWSIWLDLVVIVRTIANLLRDDRAY
jgi:Undecaprenyl-phosphate glucose phosphotransferase